MRRTILTLTLPALLVAAGQAAAGGFDVRIGGFIPRAKDCGVPSSEHAEYTLFMDVCELYVPEGRRLDDFNWKSDLRGPYGGVEYNATIAPFLELGVHLDGYSKSVDTRYRSYERDSTGGDILQTVRLSVVPLGATVRLIPTRRYTRFAPYVGGGVDAVFYTWQEEGDLINWDTGDIGPDRFRDRGVALGLHAVGGMRFYVTEDIAVVAEGRYLWAKKDMGDDFLPNASGLVNRIDLSGGNVTVGVHVRF